MHFVIAITYSYNLPIAIIETIDIEDFTNKLSDFSLI